MITVIGTHDQTREEFSATLKQIPDPNTTEIEFVGKFRSAPLPMSLRLDIMNAIPEDQEVHFKFCTMYTNGVVIVQVTDDDGHHSIVRYDP